ncbi:GntR family transcriptional regulator [Frigoribacterium sp. VKM Ac-2836]|uniref:GntR family transcriptional regulator n=1 Tax=Frigoribacterium sp. VKM Ac-2836 TaxID=2739014 RepID=UPI001563AC4F|nr:GntR family transcriptional regulator [Frigoribacterium sp. VKM Ac-2836]NRD26287.1 GntR family transcriptional regulator [Frigoribacterium sp. VKM Ac-2836]
MSTTSGTSKYVAVREHLLSRIQKLEPGSQLPAEPVLCDEYGVSRITLRHAVDGLIADGHLVREHGRGTFVTEPQYRLHYRERFADEVKGFHAQQTGEGFAVSTRVLDQKVVRAGETVASHLDISSADEVVELTRLRFVNGSLHHLVVTWLPYALFPETSSVDFTDGSLYGHLDREHGVTLARQDLLVSLDNANTLHADELDVPLGTTLLKIASTVYDGDERAVAYGTSHFTPQNSEIFFGLHG